MTVFADGTKERLHGHNYTVAVALEVERVDLAAMIPFAPIKTALRELCAEWRERVLLAAKNPHLKILRDDTELELTLCGERYVMPRGDALLLPIDNISVEALAAHVATLLVPRLASPHARRLEVTIEESPGQGATCELALG
jgi:6-pyruvoyltetrahydropterin/6-carboxytetrahydropterin synthase